MNNQLQAQQKQQFFAELQQKGNQKIREELNKITFPFNEIEHQKELSLLNIETILLKSPFLALKLDEEAYNDLINAKYTLFNISYILNNTLNLSAEQLGLTLNEYQTLISLVYKLGKIYDNNSKPIKDAIQQEMQDKASEYEKQEQIITSKAIKQKNKKVNPNLRKV